MLVASTAQQLLLVPTRVASVQQRAAGRLCATGGGPAWDGNSTGFVNNLRCRPMAIAEPPCGKGG